MLDKEENKSRLYFSISEVADYIGVPVATLRFWEKEFTIINPRKTNGGTRAYSREDIENVRLVHHLLKGKGLTLSGAKKQLRDNRQGVVQRHDIVARLTAIRSELVALRDELD